MASSTDAMDTPTRRSALATTSPEGDRVTDVLKLDLGDPRVRENLHATYAEVQGRCPVTRAVLHAGDDLDELSEKVGGGLNREVFLVLGYDEAFALLGDERLSVDYRTAMSAEQLAQLPPPPEETRPINENMLTMDPPEHTRLRRLVQKSFTPRKIEELRPRIRALADGLLDEAERQAAGRGETAPNRRMELLQSFAYPLPLTVIADLMGVPEEDRDTVHAWGELLINDGQEGWWERARVAMKEFSGYLVELFAEKRAHPADDLTTELVYAEEEGDRLSENELLAMVYVIILAGHVTTVNLIGNSVVALLTHPDQLARLKAEPELVKNAVEETLRYWPTVEMPLPRHTKEDLEFRETRIAGGETLTFVVAAANRDPAHFPSPHDFDITRPNADRHLAFGRGRHLCLGAPLARVEGQVALEALFQRMPELRLEDPSTTREAKLLPSMFRGFDSIPVLF